MGSVIAINGSPRMEQGCTEMILAPFLAGMTDAGAEVETVYASRLRVRPCDCGQMRCWYTHPGRCHHKDAMSDLLLRLEEAYILVLATPVYIPLPGDMQNVVNRFCPLLDPLLETRNGRTRARFRDDVRVRQIALVSTGGWWEIENFGTVVRIVEELALDAGVEFAGAVLRPHVEAMRRGGTPTEDGQEVLRAVRRAGSELVRDGAMAAATLEAVSRPLVDQEVFRRLENSQRRQARGEPEGSE